MLPEDVFGRYRRYKEDTDIFATWLSTQARACGYQHPGQRRDKLQTPQMQSTKASTRLKGKARKEANEAEKKREQRALQSKVKQRLPTSEILVQAEVIVNFKKPLIMVHVHALFAVITRLTLLSFHAFAQLTLACDGM